MLPDTRHELHGPWQSVVQQTPCAQKPLAHSELRLQIHSVSRRHEPFMQWVPFVQSGSPLHETAQPVPAALHL